MKKVLTLLGLAVAGFSANAAIFINNNTNCEAVLVLKAHDNNAPATCSYYSSRFPVAANTSVAFNNVTSLNTPGGPGWFSYVNGSSTMIQAGSGFDAVTVYYGNLFGGITFDIGTAGTCASSTSYTGSYPACSFTNAAWTNLGGGNILLDLN